MSGDFSIIQAKLDRARCHADHFQRCFDEFLKTGPYAATYKLDSEPPFTFRAIWKVNANPPIKLTLILGDMLNDLRGTLDYLVWQLVLQAGGCPTDRTAFPCVQCRKNWLSARGDRLKGVDPRWVDEIEKLQPYHRGDRPERHQLACLDLMSNINKHRTMPAVLTTMPEWRPLFYFEAGWTIHDEHFLGEPLEDGKEFYRLWIDPPNRLSISQQTPTRRCAYLLTTGSTTVTGSDTPMTISSSGSPTP